jgi:hypothetical protein
VAWGAATEVRIIAKEIGDAAFAPIASLVPRRRTTPLRHAAVRAIEKRAAVDVRRAIAPMR